MAGGAKRMSKDEKRKAVLDIYHTTKQVFTEKEILSLASKAGVNANTVLDINQSLVDDGLVDKDKIGGSNYFWSFPAKKDRQLQLQHEATLREIIVLKEQTVLASAKLADAKRGREDEGGERAAKLARLAELSKEHAALQIEYEALKENDPQALADLQKELELVKNAANRWTDNVFNCKTYLVKKRGMDKKEAIKILGITPAFDYPEDKIPK
ncbi:hypothetical protein MHU86_774 [Fragilaria crotonensis]|nr:hypothetical protein MHU86_774 [Fragilaria crotonensis]